MHVVIPMAGHSCRFRDAGYEGPKWLLKVGDRPMIEHVVEMFDDADEFHMVINTSQHEFLQSYGKDLTLLAPKVHVHVIEPHELGPTFSALQVPDIDDDEPVIISYCDFFVRWRYDLFLRHAHGADGAIVSFQGFHPASMGETRYAYMRAEGDLLIEIQEKRSFTEDHLNEPASAGIYYFARFEDFRRYGTKVLDHDRREFPEAYVSLLYNQMVANAKRVVLHDVEKFVCLGTPRDYEQHEFWWSYFHPVSGSDETPHGLPAAEQSASGNCTNLIPMAGRGSRFRETGYRVAKPLIDVLGEPMVLRAVRSLPDADCWIFLPRAEDVQKHPIERTLKQFAPDCDFVEVPDETSGQAATCLLAEEIIDPHSQLLIASCDYEHRFDKEAWRAIVADTSIDGAVWTFRLGSNMVKSPNAFAYCQTDPDGRRIAHIAEKTTISETPYDDPLVVGTFWFRHAVDFLQGVNLMIEKNITVNGEHYVGTSINESIATGAYFVIFEVDQWISFGDPYELRLLEYWESVFNYRETTIEGRFTGFES